MNQKEIKHLYARAGFGLTPQEWKVRKNWTIEQSIEDLFSQTATIKQLPKITRVPRNLKGMTPEEKAKERRKVNAKEKRLVAKISVDWFLRMISSSESVLVEKMSLFWHGHFACRSTRGHLAQGQLDTIRQLGLGKFRDLVIAIAKDPSMILYLDNQKNRKNKPNENFARELMELFTIGIGNYTEKDVKESARAFTGWSSTPKGKYVLRTKEHDKGEKTFMGKIGNFNGEDIIDILLEKKETAYFITKKIYRYFVNEQIDERIIAILAENFYRSDYDIKQLMRAIFSSDWFYEAKNIGTKIKSPTEFTVGLLRQLNGQPKRPKALMNIQEALGQTLFHPPNVAGWLGGQNWIDNSTLMLRLNIPTIIFSSSALSFSIKPELEEEMDKKKVNEFSTDIDFQPIIDMVAGLNQAEILVTLSDFLIQTLIAIPMENIQGFVRKKGKKNMYVKQLCLRLMSLPEYQMC